MSRLLAITAAVALVAVGGWKWRLHPPAEHLIAGWTWDESALIWYD